MKREILFRGKRLDNGEWVEGYVVSYPSGKTEIHKRCTEPPDILLVCEIAPETVCQYTGLTDRNGKKIFEGDVVNSDLGKIGKVVYNESHLAYLILETSEMKYYFIQECDGGHIEVIGNIIDTPESEGRAWGTRQTG